MSLHRKLHVVPKQDASDWDMPVVNALVTRLPGGRSSVTLRCEDCKSVFYPCLCPGKTVRKPSERRLYAPRVVCEAEDRRLGSENRRLLGANTAANSSYQPIGNLQQVLLKADSANTNKNRLVLACSGDADMTAAPPPDEMRTRQVLWREAGYWIVAGSPRCLELQFEPDEFEYLQASLDDKLVVKSGLENELVIEHTYYDCKEAHGDIILGRYAGTWEVRHVRERASRTGQARHAVEAAESGRPEEQEPTAFEKGVRPGQRLISLQQQNLMLQDSWIDVDIDEELPYCMREGREADTQDHVQRLDHEKRSFLFGRSCDESPVTKTAPKSLNIDVLRFPCKVILTKLPPGSKVTEVAPRDEDCTSSTMVSRGDDGCDGSAVNESSTGIFGKSCELTGDAFRHACKHLKDVQKPATVTFEVETHDAIAIQGRTRGRHEQRGETDAGAEARKVNCVSGIYFSLFKNWAMESRLGTHQLAFVMDQMLRRVKKEIATFEGESQNIRRMIVSKCELCAKQAPGKLKTYLTNELKDLFPRVPEYFLLQMQKDRAFFAGESKRLGLHVESSSLESNLPGRPQTDAWQCFNSLLQAYFNDHRYAQHFSMQFQKTVSKQNLSRSPTNRKVLNQSSSAPSLTKPSAGQTKISSGGKTLSRSGDRDGKLSPKEFENVLVASGVSWLDSQQIRKLFDTIDFDYNGRLTLEELMLTITRMQELIQHLIKYENDLSEDGHRLHKKNVLESFAEIILWGEDLVGPAHKHRLPPEGITSSACYKTSESVASARAIGDSDPTWDIWNRNNVRLNSKNCWVGDAREDSLWIEWRFKQPVLVTTVLTQVKKDQAHPVTKYRIEYEIKDEPLSEAHTFKPGKMGIETDEEGVVKKIEKGGQADIMGIKPGAKIEKFTLDWPAVEQTYSQGTLDKAERGTTDYTVTFLVLKQYKDEGGHTEFTIAGEDSLIDCMWRSCRDHEVFSIAGRGNPGDPSEPSTTRHRLIPSLNGVSRVRLCIVDWKGRNEHESQNHEHARHTNPCLRSTLLGFKGKASPETFCGCCQSSFCQDHSPEVRMKDQQLPAEHSDCDLSFLPPPPPLSQ